VLATRPRGSARRLSDKAEGSAAPFPHFPTPPPRTDARAVAVVWCMVARRGVGAVRAGCGCGLDVRVVGMWGAWWMGFACLRVERWRGWALRLLTHTHPGEEEERRVRTWRACTRAAGCIAGTEQKQPRPDASDDGLPTAVGRPTPNCGSGGLDLATEGEELAGSRVAGRLMQGGRRGRGQSGSCRGEGEREWRASVSGGRVVGFVGYIDWSDFFASHIDIATTQ
jgi:hypothetical protein